MHAALRVVSVERGYDPRDFGLVAFGGAGPLHANALARLIGADPLIVPTTPGVLSAFGFLAADVQNEFARTYLRLAEDTPGEHVRAAVDEIVEEATAWLHDEDVDPDDHAFEVYADCRYYRQDIQIPCALAIDGLTNGYAAVLREAFETEHLRRYGFGLDAPVEIATLRVVGRGVTRDIELERGTDSAVGEAPVDRTEQVHFDGTWHDAAIYERSRLQVGHRLAGPAIVEQEDSTTVIEPGYAGTVDEAGNIIIREGNR
jgi:N-methylhydantoinase A